MYYGMPISPYDLTFFTKGGQELFIVVKSGKQFRCTFIDSDSEGFNSYKQDNGIYSEVWIPYSFIHYVSMLHDEDGKTVVKPYSPQC